MAGSIENGTSAQGGICARMKRRKTFSLSGLSHLLCCIVLSTPVSIAYAGPTGGAIVGGAGSINPSGLTTNINQLSHSLAIDWASYNLNSNEIVNYLQPNANSIALNRILGGSASDIRGQINANGHVVLVNPNGIFFSETAVINVGGLIASGLAIDPIDFMNGDYVFKSIDGTTGAIINGGVINASLGGSVALLGKQVINNGLISATLGSVTLAAGNEAVLTFDNDGLLGVQITKAVLQDELGVDPAILNTGEITAESGRVLLTASQSQDVFSHAVNSGDMQQATSVVVHEDGSFTLGGGADVVNTGVIDVSAKAAGSDAGRVVILGENITSSGVIKADAINADGGVVELHARDKTKLINTAQITATSESGKGGTVKVLGDKVGLFDNSVVDASGGSAGGEILIGGDYQGKNRKIKNANVTYVGEDAVLKANAINTGDGGKVIVWADDTARYYGSIEAHAGRHGGDGGFAEVSGKRYLGFAGRINLSATDGITGTLLLDPNNITIANGGANIVAANDAFAENSGNDVTFDADLITDILTGNGVPAANVELQAIQDIVVNEAITVGTSNINSLTLRAGDDIEINSDITMTEGDLIISANDPGCPLPCTAGGPSDGGGVAGRNIALGANLITNGGNVSLSAENIVITGASATRSVDTAGSVVDGNITFTGAVLSGDTTNQNSLNLTAGTGNITINGDIGTAGDNNFLESLTINSANLVTLNAVRAGSAGINVMASTVALFGNLDTNDNSSMGNINFSANVLLNGAIQFDTGGGSVDIAGNVNANAANMDSVRFVTSTGDIAINGAIGNTSRLNQFRIDAAGVVSLGTQSVNGGINANQVTVTQSGSFDTNGFGISTVRAGLTGGAVEVTSDSFISTGFINTSGGTATTNTTGRSAGIVSLAGTDITVGTITARGSNANGTGDLNGGNGGAVSLVATENNGTRTPSITLNGNIDTRGGAPVNDGVAPASGMQGVTGTKDIRLEGMDIGMGVANGTFTIGSYTSAFTGGLTVISNTDGSDTFLGANTGSTWTVTGNNQGTLAESNVNFIGFENLTGGDLIDVFNLTDGFALDGDIDGGAGANFLNGRNNTNNWAIDGIDSGSVDGVGGFSNIQTLIGNAGNDNFDFTSGEITGSIIGGAGTDSLTANDTNNTWALTGASSGSVESVANFSGIETLIGGSANDNFQLATGFIFAGSIDGGANGTDTVTGRNSNTNWAITGVNSGTVDGLMNGFSNIDVLAGNNANDTYILSNSAVFAGSIDGGLGANRINGANQDTTWQLTGPDAGSVTGLGAGFNNIQTLTGNLMTDTLIGNNNPINNWNIFGFNSGSVTDLSGSFSGMENLSGGTGNDTFIYGVFGSLTGLIDGGGGSGIDTVDLTSKNFNLTVELGTTITTNFNVNNVEVINANTGFSNNLIADDLPITNTWEITDDNAGQVISDNGGVMNTTAFNGFSTLTGGDGADDFTIINGTISGSVLGMAGADTLSLNLTGAETGSVFFDGGTEVNTVAITGGSAAYTGQYDSAVGIYERIRHTEAGNTYDINFRGVADGGVDDSATASSFTVNGTAANDAIVLGTNTYEVNSATQVVFTNKTDVIIDGLAGTDNVNINGNVSVSGMLALMIENITQTGGGTINAGTLLLDGVNTAGSPGNRLNTQIDNLRLRNVTGNVYLDEQTQISIAELTNHTGMLDIVNQTGNILDGTDLVISTNMHLDSQTGSIILDNNNQLSGELFLAATNGDVTLNNTVSTVLGDVSAQNLTITSNGITDSATSQITVTNSTTLNGGGQDIELDGGNQQFSNLTVTNTNNLMLADANGLIISDVTVTGNAVITAGGNVQLGNLNAGNTANLSTTAAINDSNGGSANVTANNVVLHAASGIGSGDAIETVTASLDVVNTASNDVEISNTGVVELIALKNTGSDGNITIFNDLDYNINPGSIVANRSSGNLLMTTQAGSFLGLGNADISNPDITAQSAIFFGRAGTFGTFNRPLTLDVPGSVLIDTRASFDPQFVPPGPSSLSTLGLDFSGILGALSALGGEQLVEVESLGEIDEAIFTDLQNFSMEEISLRLPRDQLFEDELEEYDRL